MQNDSQRQELRSLIKDSAAKQDAAATLSFVKQLLAISSKPADAMFCSSSIAGIKNTLRTHKAVNALKTFIVRSVTVEPILPYLATQAALAGYLLDLRLGGFGSFVDELLNSDSDLARFQPDLVLIVLDLEEIAGRLPQACADGIGSAVETEIEESVARIGQLLRTCRSRNSTRILLQGLIVPDFTSLGDVGDANVPHGLANAVQRLNRRLASLCRAITDCVFFDVDRLAARHGRARWRDARMYLASRLPVSAEFFLPYSRGLVRTFSTLFRAPRKVLCTDLDNTLWGGILGEDGIDGISTGSAFPGNSYLEYQIYLKQLLARGILLAIASKNNETDVREAFQARSADLALTFDDFVATRINWNDKSQSIRELAKELSVGLDSFVFVDDNPAECEAIRQQLPEVAVVAAPVEEPWKLVEILADQPFFDTAAVTEDDVNRGGEYKAQAQRAEFERTVGSRDEFLASMGIVCTFQSALHAPLPRAVQLLSKTNQFNLTTRRRSAAEIEEFASVAGGQAIAIRVHDRFGDAGVVGLALARNRGDSCYIDSLLLSCRVIGRGIETALLAYIAEQALRNGATRLVGEFIPTNKNSPCTTFYSDHGFNHVLNADASEPDSLFYELELTTATLIAPKWITLEGNESHELSASTVFSA
jgi:FkbH-like protein